MSQITAQQEADALDAILTRLASVLDKFLVAVLLRFNSPHEITRKKVMDILTHVNKRVKPDPTIQLPMKSLMELFLSSDVSQIVQNFLLIYIKMGFERLPPQGQEELLPSILRGISKKNAATQATVLGLVVSALVHVTYARTKEDRRAIYDFCESPEDSAVLLKYLQNFMLKATGDESKQKFAVVKFVTSGLFEDNAILPLLLIASADNSNTVFGAAEDAMKRLYNLDMEQKGVVMELFALYLGPPATLSTAQSATPAEKPAPTPIPLRVKVLNQLCRSTLATNSIPQTLQVIFDGLYGTSTNLKLKQAAMEFVHWTFRMAKDTTLKPVAPLILSSLVKFVKQFDAPTDESAATTTDASSPAIPSGPTVLRDNETLRAFTLSALGRLATRCPDLFHKDFELVEYLFGLVNTESAPVRMSAQECLNAVALALQNPSETMAESLYELLFKAARSQSPYLKDAALLWSRTVFPFSNAHARLVCIICMDDPRADIKESARKGLQPYYLEGENTLVPSPYPLFPDFMKASERLLSQDRLQSTAHLALLSFSRQSLIYSADAAKTAPHDYFRGLADSEPQAVESYLKLVEEGLQVRASSELQLQAMKCLLEQASFNRERSSSVYAGRLPWIQNFVLNGTKPDTREAAAQLLGIVLRGLPANEAQAICQNLIKALDDPHAGMELHHGAINGIGAILAAMRRNGVALEEWMQSALRKIATFLTSDKNIVVSATLRALGAIGEVAPLGLPEGEVTAWDAAGSLGVTTTPQPASKRVKTDDDQLTLGEVVENLIKCTQHNYSQVIEDAVVALGRVARGDHNGPATRMILDSLFSLVGNKQEEVQFTNGEAIARAVGGVYFKEPKDADSLVVIDDSNAAMSDVTYPDTDPSMTAALKRIMEHIYGELPQHRMSACIWLLEILQFSGQHPTVQKFLPEIQSAFRHLLGDTKDVTQEVASKGLSLVFDSGDSSMKESLVADLVESISGTKTSIPKSSADSTIMPTGMLGKAPEALGGGEMSTYKEFCSIASEMQKPDLVYKFLDLARHHAMWNSKKGAAFGFSVIAEHGRKQLEPYLPKLLPMLFRYQYDPNQHVQDAMTNIWRALVIDPKKTIDEYFDIILRDLLSQMGNRQWRVREACCLALADLIPQREVDQVGQYIEDMWNLTFRVLDDVKETCRLAAAKTCQSLNKLSIKLCDPERSGPSKAQKAITFILPLLLAKGVAAEATDVRKFSLTTILAIVKAAGSLIRPHIPELVGTMLEALSSLESQQLSYSQMHAGDVEEQFEAVRVMVSKNSVMSQINEACLKYVDETVIKELVPRLASVVRSGIGLPTRAGTASFIMTLCAEHKMQMLGHTKNLLRAVSNAMSDSSLVVSKSMAAAAAAICSCSKEYQVEEHIEYLVKTYKEAAEDERARMLAANAMRALAKYAATVTQKYLPKLLPAMFLAMHDPSDDVAKQIKLAWEDLVPSTSSAARMYMAEILPAAMEAVNESAYAMKKQGAAALRTLALHAGTALNPHTQDLLGLLTKTLGGRVWEGKEAILEALAAVCAACKDNIPVDQQKEIIRAVVADCKKQSKVYRLAAVQCLSKLLATFVTVDLYTEVIETLTTSASATEEAPEDPATALKRTVDTTFGVPSQVPMHEEAQPKKDSQQTAGIKLAAIEAFEHAWAGASEETRMAQVKPLFNYLSERLRLDLWQTRIAIMKSLKAIFVNMTASMVDAAGEEMVTVLKELQRATEDTKYASVRAQAGDALNELSKRFTDSSVLKAQKEVLLASATNLSRDTDPRVQGLFKSIRDRLV